MPAPSDRVPRSNTISFPLVEIAGGNPSEFQDLDGVSLLQVLQTNSTLNRGEPIYAYRAYQDLYVSVREGPWKLMAYRSGKTNLYQVEEDRYEQKDMAAEHPAQVQQLLKKLKAWEKEMGVVQYSGVQ